jgi:hypothetical protein
MDPDDGVPDGNLGVDLGADIDQYDVGAGESSAPPPRRVPPARAAVRTGGARGARGPSARADADDGASGASAGGDAGEWVQMQMTSELVAAAPGGVDDDDDDNDDDDFQSPVDFETASAKANRLLGDENKIPKLHYTEDWHELPSTLTVDTKFDSQVACESIAMATRGMLCIRIHIEPE